MIDDQAEIEMAEAELRQAMLQSDVSKLNNLIDDNLLFVGPAGAVLSKSEDLSLYRSGEQKITGLDVKEQNVRVNSGVAAVSVLAFMSGVYKNQVFQTHLRYLRVWHRTPSGWKIFAGSVVTVSE